MGKYRVVECMEDFTIEQWLVGTLFGVKTDNGSWCALDESGRWARVHTLVILLPKHYNSLVDAKRAIDMFKRGEVIHEIDD